MKKIKDPRANLIIEFFESQGIKFIDSETGEDIITTKGDENEKD